MKKLLVALCMILVFMLSGCSFMSLENSQIMCPPKATGSQAEIQKLIDKNAVNEYTLKYPKNGLYRSSIVMYNIDTDDEEEAIAFYSDKEGDHIHVLFIEYKDSKYSVVDSHKLDTSSIDRLDFSDLDGDGKCEILLGYEVTTSPHNTLCIMTYINDKIKLNDATYTYTNFVTGDFNNDKQDDVLLVSLNSGNTDAKALLMAYKNGELKELASTELDADIKQLANIQYGQISQGTYGAVLDGVNSISDYTTQIILYDTVSETLLNPLYNYNGYALTHRANQIHSLDYNDDKLIDIPLCSLMMHNSTENTDFVSRQIDWANLDTATYTLNTTESAIFCGQDGYLLNMPDKWDNDTVTARYRSDKRELTVYVCLYNAGDPVYTDELLTIKAYSDDEFDEESTGFIEFERHGATVYTYSVSNTDDYLSISGDEISSLFTPISI